MQPPTPPIAPAAPVERKDSREVVRKEEEKVHQDDVLDYEEEEEPIVSKLPVVRRMVVGKQKINLLKISILIIIQKC